jgi:signal transduction histidine kinase
MKKSSSYKILIVTTDEQTYTHYTNLLSGQSKYNIASQSVFNIKEAYSRLVDYQPDAVLMEKGILEEGTGLFLQELKHSKSFRRYPVIWLTQLKDGKKHTRAFKLGVQDILLTDELTAASLINSIVKVVKNNRLIEKLKEQRKTLLEKNKELGEYKKYLELRMMSRTAELKESYEQLVEEMMLRKRIEEQLTSRNKELDTFVYKASHDLKGPLASLIGVTNIARLDLTQPMAVKYLEMINESAQKLNFILANLLEVTKIKYIDPEIKVVDFNDLLKGIVADFASRLEAEQIQLDIEISQKQVFMSDPYLIATILQHLLDNAIHYKKGYGDPVISIEIQDTTGGVEICVNDNGQGIDKDVQSKVFDMFYRHNLQSKGSGLGLYISRNCVEKLSGEIILSSQLDEGTEIKIMLPDLKKIHG